MSKGKGVRLIFKEGMIDLIAREKKKSLIPFRCEDSRRQGLPNLGTCSVFKLWTEKFLRGLYEFGVKKSPPSWQLHFDTVLDNAMQNFPDNGLKLDHS